MGCTVDELGQRMSGEEFGLHWADYRRQPWGPQRDEVHAAMIAATVARFAGRRSEDPAAVRLEDFAPISSPRPAEPDPIAFAQSVNAAIERARG